ncbi:MAG: glycosyltransferase family 4 protein [Candidatus Peribacteraceae bacterium]|nr:glycosyltransferase family 4 protein [Candidatus Peribacteraceae bacterium]
MYNEHMHIVILNDDFPMEGGDSVAHLTNILAEGIRKYNHKVTIITTHRKADSKDILSGENDNQISIPISYRPSLRSYLSLYNPPVSKSLQKVLNRLKPDIVHAHSIHQYLSYDALRIAKKHTDKIFLTCHDTMGIAFGRIATNRYISSTGKNLRLSPLDHIRTARLEYNPFRNTLIRSCIKKNVQTVTAVSHALADCIEANGIPNVKTIHNGIDIAYWKPNQKDVIAFLEKHNLTGKKIVLFSGRLRREKGVPQLVNAMNIVRKKVPNAMLVIVGEKERWEGLFKEASVPDDMKKYCYCTGWLSHKELAIAYGSAHIVSTPSVYLDPFVLVNLEAMSNYKPVIGTVFGGTKEIVINNETGFVRNPLKTKHFAYAILALLQDDNLARKMGEAGNKRVHEQFTIKKMIDEYLTLYTK